jgi:hypothetical protein
MLHQRQQQTIRDIGRKLHFRVIDFVLPLSLCRTDTSPCSVSTRVSDIAPSASPASSSFSFAGSGDAEPPYCSKSCTGEVQNMLYHYHTNSKGTKPLPS